MKNRLRIAGGIGSGLVLALLPQCPVCLAAYLAVLTGLGVSVAVAAIVKASLAAVCGIILAWLLSTALLRFAAKRRNRSATLQGKLDVVHEPRQAMGFSHAQYAHGCGACVEGAAPSEGSRQGIRRDPFVLTRNWRQLGKTT
jgi:hypothetical protein